MCGQDNAVVLFVHCHITQHKDKLDTVPCGTMGNCEAGDKALWLL